MRNYLQKNRKKVEKRNMKKTLKEKKNEIYFKTRHERKMLKGNIKKINQTEREVAEKENKIIQTRRELRKRYIESLNVGDVKLVENAKQSILNYEIGLKLQEQENERDF